MEGKRVRIIGVSVLMLLVLSPSMTEAVPNADDVVSVFSANQRTTFEFFTSHPEPERRVLFGPLPFKTDLGVTMLVVSNHLAFLDTEDAQSVELIATTAAPYESAKDCEDADGETVMRFSNPPPLETVTIPMAQPWRVSAPPLGRISLASDFWCLTAQSHRNTSITIAAYEAP